MHAKGRSDVGAQARMSPGNLVGLQVGPTTRVEFPMRRAYMRGINFVSGDQGELRKG